MQVTNYLFKETWTASNKHAAGSAATLTLLALAHVEAGLNQASSADCRLSPIF